MRPLSEEETKILFEKLVKLCVSAARRPPPAHGRARSMGKNVRYLLERTDEKHCFRLHRDRVYYVRCAISPRTAW